MQISFEGFSTFSQIVELKEYVVAVDAQSMSEMGALRYWEIHVKATSQQMAFHKAKEAMYTWSVFNVSYRILQGTPAPRGAICYVEVL